MRQRPTRLCRLAQSKPFGFCNEDSRYYSLRPFPRLTAGARSAGASPSLRAVARGLRFGRRRGAPRAIAPIGHETFRPRRQPPILRGVMVAAQGRDVDQEAGPDNGQPSRERPPDPRQQATPPRAGGDRDGPRPQNRLRPNGFTRGAASRPLGPRHGPASLEPYRCASSRSMINIAEKSPWLRLTSASRRFNCSISSTCSAIYQSRNSR